MTALQSFYLIQQSGGYRDQNPAFKGNQHVHANYDIPERPYPVRDSPMDRLHGARPTEASRNYDIMSFDEGFRQHCYKGTGVDSQHVVKRQQHPVPPCESNYFANSFHDGSSPHNYDHYYESSQPSTTKINRVGNAAYRDGSFFRYGGPDLRSDAIVSTGFHQFPERLYETRSSPQEAYQNTLKPPVTGKIPIFSHSLHPHDTKRNAINTLGVKTIEPSSELLHKRFIVLKCLYYDIIAKAKYDSVWPTRRSTAGRLNSMLRNGDDVYLLFSLDNSQHFQGTHFCTYFQELLHFLIT